MTEGTESRSNQDNETYHDYIPPLATRHWSNAAFACQAEPRRGPVSVELGAAELQNLQSRFDRQSDVPGRAARRTYLAWRPFRAADEAKPETARGQDRGDLCGKTSALLRFVEDMEAAAVEHKMERSPGRRGREKVQGTEAATELAAIQLCCGLFDRVAARCRYPGLRTRVPPAKGSWSLSPRQSRASQRAECDPL